MNFLALKFANVLGLDEEILELLYEQFHEYRKINDAELPDEAYEEAFFQEQVMVIKKSTVLM